MHWFLLASKYKDIPDSGSYKPKDAPNSRSYKATQYKSRRSGGPNSPSNSRSVSRPRGRGQNNKTAAKTSPGDRSRFMSSADRVHVILCHNIIIILLLTLYIFEHPWRPRVWLCSKSTLLPQATNFCLCVITFKCCLILIEARHNGFHIWEPLNRSIDANRDKAL